MARLLDRHTTCCVDPNDDENKLMLARARALALTSRKRTQTYDDADSELDWRSVVKA